MDADKAEAILREHLRLCGDLHEIFIEEGKVMRATGAPPDEAFLERKGGYLPVLGKGLELLQRIGAEPESFPRSLGPLVKDCRAMIMKLMMLDRENERLLLKCTLPPKMRQSYGKVAPGQLAKVYGKYAV